MIQRERRLEEQEQREELERQQRALAAASAPPIFARILTATVQSALVTSVKGVFNKIFGLVWGILVQSVITVLSLLGLSNRFKYVADNVAAPSPTEQAEEQ